MLYKMRKGEVGSWGRGSFDSVLSCISRWFAVCFVCVRVTHSPINQSTVWVSRESVRKESRASPAVTRRTTMRPCLAPPCEIEAKVCGRPRKAKRKSKRRQIRQSGMVGSSFALFFPLSSSFSLAPIRQEPVSRRFSHALAPHLMNQINSTRYFFTPSVPSPLPPFAVLPDVALPIATHTHKSQIQTLHTPNPSVPRCRPHPASP